MSIISFALFLKNYPTKIKSKSLVLINYLFIKYSNYYSAFIHFTQFTGKTENQQSYRYGNIGYKKPKQNQKKCNTPSQLVLYTTNILKNQSLYINMKYKCFPVFLRQNSQA